LNYIDTELFGILLEVPEIVPVALFGQEKWKQWTIGEKCLIGDRSLLADKFNNILRFKSFALEYTHTLL
jgi:hypothetical protein